MGRRWRSLRYCDSCARVKVLIPPSESVASPKGRSLAGNCEASSFVCGVEASTSERDGGRGPDATHLDLALRAKWCACFCVDRSLNLKLNRARRTLIGVKQRQVFHLSEYNTLHLSHYLCNGDQVLAPQKRWFPTP